MTTPPPAPTVLVTITYPRPVAPVFQALAERGYKIIFFDVTDQSDLVKEASRLSDEGRPVAMICSEVMQKRKDNFLPDGPQGEQDGQSLAETFARAVQTQSLSIIYSTMVDDDLRDVGTDKTAQTVRISKFHSPHPETDAELIGGSLDRFFGRTL